jgi:hypothetical protein
MSLNRFLLLTLTAIACQADPSSIVVRCDLAHPCPAGLICQADQTCGQEPAQVDAGADMTAGSDLSPPYGCTVPDGKPVGASWACPVTLQKGQGASTICASGFSLCKDASRIDQAACKALSGFYFADIFDSYDGSLTNAPCTTRAGTRPTFWGCGRINITAPAIVFQMPKQCAGFERAIDCSSVLNLNCTYALNDANWVGVSGLGVLCCPM